jgi:hypothetical protein
MTTASNARARHGRGGGRRRVGRWRLFGAVVAIAAAFPDSCALGQQPAAAAPAPPAPAPPGEPGDESAQYVVETVASGLDNPTSIAVRAGSSPTAAPFELLVSESGAGRVVRFASDKPGEATPAITGFPVDKLGGAPEFRTGPLGLAFITRTKLAVGTSGAPEGGDEIRVYSLPEDGSALAYEAIDHVAGPVGKSEQSKTGEGDFFSLAANDEALFASAHGDPDEGWVLKARLSANRLTDLQPFIASRRLTGVGGPLAATVNPKPQSSYLLVAQAGEGDSARDSVVGFYAPISGALALSFQTGLYDIAGLAYSPAGELYAVDLARHRADQGGVYRLDAAVVDDRESCRAVKIAAVERPAALAFAPDGALYVAALGARDDADQPPTGVLLKVTPGPEAAKF